MSDLSTDEFLSHFGVKGMHWGVRREQLRQHRTKFNEWDDGSKSKKVVKNAAIVAAVYVGARFVLRHAVSLGMRTLRNVLERQVMSEGAVWVAQSAAQGTFRIGVNTLL